MSLIGSIKSFFSGCKNIFIAIKNFFKSSNGPVSLFVDKNGEPTNEDINIAVAGLVVTKTIGTKVYVQTADMVGNWPYSQAVTTLNEDLNTDKVNLYTYDIEQDAMIVNNDII